MKGGATPPKWAERLLARCLPEGIRGRSILGDLHEAMAWRYPRGGFYAASWYVWEGARLAARYGPERLWRRLMRPRRRGMLDGLRQDIAFATRTLSRQPVFTLVAVMTLAVGVGATTLVFSALNASLLTPLPVADPGRLVVVDESRRGGNVATMGRTAFSYERYLGYREASAGALSGLAGHRLEQFSWRAEGEARLVTGAVVTGNYFEVLGVRAGLGRLFTGALDSLGGEAALVVVGYDFWQRELGGNNSVLGRTVRIDSRPYTVVGVAPRGFGGTMTSLMMDVWVPAATYRLPFNPSPDSVARPRVVWMNFFGRLAPGVSMAGAEAVLDAAAPRVPAEDPDTEVLDVRLEPLTGVPMYRGAMIGFMALLLATAGMVLLIVAANLGGMLIARATARRREFAIRLAIGAGRIQLMRQLLVEVLILFLAGGGTGIILAFWLSRVVAALRLPVPVEVSLNYPIDERVLFFALLVVLFTGIAFGVAPALQASRFAPALALKDGVGAGVRRSRVRNAFVIGQFAASLMLLVTATTFVLALQKALAIDPGFDPVGVVRGEVSLSSHGYDRARGAQFFERLRQNLFARPEIMGVARALFEPLSSNNNNISANLPEQRAAGGEGVTVPFGIVDPTYFATLRTRFAAGRVFSEAEARTADVAVINETMARQFFGAADPIGRRIVLGEVETEVVGVVRDGKYRSLREPQRPYAFLPFGRRFGSPTTAVVYVHARTDEAAALAALREEIAALDADVVLQQAGTATDGIAFLLIPQRIAAIVIGCFGVVGLVLAAMGVYGLISYYVVQRTREFGVRLALGGNRWAVVEPVVMQGLRLTTIGLVVGALLAFGVVRLASSFLYGIDAADLPTLAVPALVLTMAALLASYVPARKASRVDPLVALRTD
jgi:predicted permease